MKVIAILCFFIVGTILPPIMSYQMIHPLWAVISLLAALIGGFCFGWGLRRDLEAEEKKKNDTAGTKVD